MSADAYRQWPPCRTCERPTTNLDGVCGRCSMPLDERIYDALEGVGLDETDATEGTRAVMAVLAEIPGALSTGANDRSVWSAVSTNAPSRTSNERAE